MGANKSLSGAFARHGEVLQKTIGGAMPDVVRAVEVLAASITAGHKLLACGNGGSAADAQHFAAEFVCKYKGDRRPLPALALTTDTSALTAIGNDFGFEFVFSRQIEALGEAGDILVALTTSGTSPNILKAIEAAKKKQMKVVALTGAKGTSLKDMADIAVVVPSEETARIQEMHGLILHAWCEYIDSVIQDK